MGIFRRRGDDNQDLLAELLFQGESMIEQLAQAHRTWGLGTADRWDLDQRTGIISWTFPHGVASAPAQIVASYNPSAGSWLWSWANQSILPGMSRDAHAMREWGAANGVAVLTQPKVDTDDETAASLAALAVRITRATGFYRGTGAAAVPIITFGAVTLTDQDGATRQFTIDVADHR
ncbi:DUF6882 domain-containing protein [Actinophytocola sp. NPDC049390]|uniref:DUF6882 domain-containing protein n=1 Tax=Actinophytocola sp. NPDC049390 TaxID=3363894 RepID=UPI0037A7CBB4